MQFCESTPQFLATSLHQGRVFERPLFRLPDHVVDHSNNHHRILLHIFTIRASFVLVLRILGTLVGTAFNILADWHCLSGNGARIRGYQDRVHMVDHPGSFDDPHRLRYLRGVNPAAGAIWAGVDKQEVVWEWG